MNRYQYFTTVVISGVAFVLGFACVVFGQSTAQLRDQLEKNRAAVQEGITAQQLLNSLLQDTAQAAARDPVLEEFLKKNGIGIRPENPTPGLGLPGEPAPAPAPNQSTP